ncbi:type VI secretion system Vgr family protein [Azotobacter chroococcum]|uniref:type VI secretion system Vgr family protein n=1 Tax=Azotobacter chroococcum TaxID=353 RepID=UPI0010AE1A16|nr:type VI secretion system tip protein TssI/VgrG [Azotobacter chroococcum]TKD46936.1 type VI secretion system tip protein VgrG [Azotobacter chroococcum]
MVYSQQARPYIFSSPLGETLMLRSFRGREAVSELFHFDLELISELDNIDSRQLLRQKATLSIDLDNGEERHWSGEIAAFARTGQNLHFTTYHCELVPPLWFLLHHEDVRHFQNLSVPQIIEQVLGEFALDFRSDYQEVHKPLDYCVQFQETHADFIARLMEQDGLHYYNRYEKTHSQLVITDHANGYPILAQPSILYHYADLAQNEDCISHLQRDHRLRTGRVVMRDYNFEQPLNDLQVSVDTLVRKGDNQPFERFLYAAGYQERSDGERLAKLTMEAEETRHEILSGLSNVRVLTPGYRFTLVDHPDDELNTDYLVLSVEHQGSNNVEDEPANYSNSFSILPLRVPYRSMPLVRKKRAWGPQTAVVVGPKGEEIHTDRHGRVKIQFHWDRRGHGDERSSCWVRVAQSWAGNGWGSFVLPRVGQEVLVHFLDGDPDRPLITGCLYNGVNQPPYALPEFQTCSTFKTLTTPDGGGGNELRFEDRKGKEEVFIHAERDLNVLVKRGINERATHHTLSLDKHQHTQTGAEWTLTAQKQIELSTDSHYSLTATAGIKQVSAHDLLLSASTGILALSDTTIEIGANTSLVLSVGASSIVLSPAGIDITGPLVKINCGGPTKVGKGSAKAAELQLEQLAITFGKKLKDKQSGQTFADNDKVKNVSPVQRLANDPSGQVRGRAAAISGDADNNLSASPGGVPASTPPSSGTTENGTPTGNLAQQEQARALQNAARSGQPFVEQVGT